MLSCMWILSSYSQHTNLKKCRDMVDSITIVMDSSSVNLLRDTNSVFGKRKPNVISLNNQFRSIYQLLVEIEKEEKLYFSNQLSRETSEFLYSINELKIIQGLYKAAVESLNPDDIELQKIREVFLNKIGDQVNIMSKNVYPFYNYNVKNKRIIKGIILNSANDLFTLAGLTGELTPIEKDRSFFQRNNDMDFTGALKFGVVTDYLKINRNREIKSYQVLSYGFEVYTPYYRIDSIFNNDTSYNVNDRPHASIRYISLESNGVSKNYGFRWNTQLKIGKIGGNIGKIFQTVLHQDVSSSPRPVGWGAQIANTGRLAVSLEYRPEYLLIQRNKEKINKRFKHFFPSLTGDIALGNYMTYVGLGLQLSNKNFRSSNQDYMTVRETTKRLKWYYFQHLHVNFHARYRYVQHNTMLEGYGFFNTTEQKDDEYTPKSIYKLKSNQINRFMQYYDLTFSTQKKYFNVYYKMSIKSPEVKNVGSTIDAKGNVLNLNTRWHHYATLGLVFKIQ